MKKIVGIFLSCSLIFQPLSDSLFFISKWAVCVVFIFSTSACIRSVPNALQTSGEPTGFTASLSCNGCISELDFSNPPDFKARTQCDREVLETKTTVSTTDPADKTADKIFKFIGKGRIREAGNNAFIYKYDEITEGELFPYYLEIWTDIKRLSSDNMEFMGVEKTPFCIAVLEGPEGIVTTPLNNNEGSQEDWIKCLQ